MGALGSVVSTIGTIGSAISTVNSAIGNVRNASETLTRQEDERRRDQLKAQQQAAIGQLKQSQDEALRAQEENAALSRAKIGLDAQSAERERKAALRRAVARQKTAFAAQGLGADISDGSSQAVLLGLFDESDEEKSSRDRLDNLRLSALDQDIEQQKRVNVLQRQQLLERQNLERIYNEN